MNAPKRQCKCDPPEISVIIKEMRERWKAAVADGAPWRQAERAALVREVYDLLGEPHESRSKAQDRAVRYLQQLFGMQGMSPQTRELKQEFTRVLSQFLGTLRPALKSEPAGGLRQRLFMQLEVLATVGDLLMHAHQDDTEDQARAQQARALRPKKQGACVRPPGRPKGSPCSGDWDKMIECIRRSGGIKADPSTRAELVHAYGKSRLPPGLLNKDGKSLKRIAEILVAEGFIRPDEHGRADEYEALEFIAEALRAGENPRASFSACASDEVSGARPRRKAIQAPPRQRIVVELPPGWALDQ